MGRHTPLQWAADGGHLEIAQALLEEGADVNALHPQCCARTAIEVALRNGHGIS
ncbi:MAG TPA: ankyrin repeat domain-containing protein [Candidatus Xenobia bacterium]